MVCCGCLCAARLLGSCLQLFAIVGGFCCFASVFSFRLWFVFMFVLFWCLLDCVMVLWVVVDQWLLLRRWLGGFLGGWLELDLAAICWLLSVRFVGFVICCCWVVGLLFGFG